MRLVIVTGMSGGGKSTALKMLEDAGYYCVDNLPLPLIDKFMELVRKPGSEIHDAALGVDVRTDGNFSMVGETLSKLREKGYEFDVLFMDASDHTLLTRYKATRRIHPLAPEGRVEEGIKEERELLTDLKKNADYILDTSELLTRELKEEIERIFVQDKNYNNLMISLTSFGFKNGIPADADLVFDVRFLPNPYYVEELKPKTGNDREVQEYVMQTPDAEEFLVKLENMLQFLIPRYVEEGKHHLVVAIGCTGGHHRSVTITNKLYERMKNSGEYGLKLYHRDIR